MNIELIDKWLENEYGVSYTRLEELHVFVVEQDLKHQEKAEKEIKKLKTIINNAIKYIEKNTHNIYADGYRDRETGELLSIEKTPIVNRIFSENPQKLLEILHDRQQ